ncbi:4327_t:CDS:1 [Funneliformis caledonium]|uniref:4327_t:CDS:1 n=2 Tax=Funneliformis TaxID=1117308 RepID=A0A9N8WG04_9GLOM|nr:4327_t:CDS:1 [Funneliformis caledonium]CAG8515624.1 4568_t:CDS:1 [Funneliformis mosseae]
MSFRLNFAQPILTLIYNPTCSKSNKVLSILHEALEKRPGVFKLDLLDYQKQPPTKDQLTNIINYLNLENDLNQILRNENVAAEGTTKVKGPSSIQELANLVKEQPIRLQRPILVDWNNGRAIIARPPEKAGGFLKDLGYLND